MGVHVRLEFDDLSSSTDDVVAFATAARQLGCLELSHDFDEHDHSTLIGMSFTAPSLAPLLTAGFDSDDIQRWLHALDQVLSSDGDARAAMPALKGLRDRLASLR